MQRFFDFLKAARQRINAKIAILVVVSLLGTGAVWQGFSYMAAKKPPTGPKRQVATGTNAGGAKGQTATTAATVSDEASPTAAGTHRLVSAYDQVPDGGGDPAEADPYAGDPYGGSSNQADPYAAAAKPSTAPPTATPPTTTQPATSPYGRVGEAQPPTNPYRAGLSDDSPTQPATSPYAVNDQTDSPAAAEAAESAAPADDPIAAYQRRFAQGSKTTPPAEQPEASADTLAGSPYREQPSATLEAPPSETPPLRLPASNGLSAPRAIMSAPPAAIAADAGAIRGALPSPAERQLEGPQQPAIAIEKFSPAEIQVGKQATFELVVRNTGQVAAQNVVITDHVPAGTQLIDARPQPAQSSDGSLVWQLGTMQPGDEQTLTLQVMPQEEGEIGSTAYVTFAAQATSRSICTRPQLTIEHTAPTKVLIGESLAMGITVANPGTGPATGVMIEENVPDGLAHVAGAELEYEVGTLRPGESKRLELSLRADKPGLIENTIVVRGEGGLASSHKVQIEVIAPQLEVEVSGPKKRFLQRQATYTVSVANPGTAPARDVELAAYLPRGMRFVEAESQGQYDQAQHAVFWSLEELPPSKAGSVKLTTLPVEPGEQRLRIEGKADLGLTVAGEQIVQVEQSAELLHTVKDADEVIEVGSETTYLIKVSNAGTKAATNVRVVALLPPEIKGTAGEGPTRATGDATRIVFEPLARLNPQEEVTFKVQVQGVAAGDHIVRVQLSSDEWPTPVTREESTRVYEDR